MKNKSKGLSADTITAIAAIIIALIALGISVWQGYETRRHNRLSVTPKLTYDYSLSSAYPEVAIKLSNNGIGPAIIKDFALHVDGIRIEDIGYGGWKSVGNKLNTFQPWVRSAFLNKEDVMRVGETKMLFSVDRKNINRERKEIILKAFSRLKISIEYESIYGDNYLIEIDETERFSKTTN